MAFLSKYAAASGGGVQWLLVFLGNYGSKYDNTRHNIGFLVADRFADREKISLKRLRFRSLTEQCDFAGSRVLLMKPQTYMNLSGEAVGEAARFYKIPPQNVLVIYDDVSLPLGKLRIRPSGSAGGHNGIRNIIDHLGTDSFPRIKIGVGAPEHPEQGLVDWVLGTFSAADRKVLDPIFDRAMDAAACIVRNGCADAMNRYNGG